MPEAALPITADIGRRLAGRPLLALLDVDGTLAPIAPRPNEAAVPAETRRVLEALVAAPDTHVAIVSGRASDDARRIVGIEGVWVIGNHGIEVAPPERTPSVRDEVAPFADRVAAAAARVSEFAHGLPGILVENKQWTASVHYRLADPAVVPALAAAVDRAAREEGLVVKQAKKNLELRPPVRIDKGTAAVELARDLGALNAQASVLVAGDDLTDEDMFRALRHAHPSAVTVRVEHEPPDFATAAEFTVAGPDALRELLAAIVDRR